MKRLQHNPPVTRNARRPVQNRRKGFVLVLVVLIIAVMGAEMFVLSGISNRMLFDANNAQLEAIERNLTAAGLAWARYAGTQNTEAFGRTVELDVASMGVSGAALSVTLGVPKDKTVQVQVNTTCSRGPRTLTRTHSYLVNLPANSGT
ncbi:MAG: hypothetical protein ACYST6_13270 [Planctomycetota bacterium]|jgi:hypothetical protein